MPPHRRPSSVHPRPSRRASSLARRPEHACCHSTHRCSGIPLPRGRVLSQLQSACWLVPAGRASFSQCALASSEQLPGVPSYRRPTYDHTSDDTGSDQALALPLSNPRNSLQLLPGSASATPARPPSLIQPALLVLCQPTRQSTPLTTCHADEPEFNAWDPRVTPFHYTSKPSGYAYKQRALFFALPLHPASLGVNHLASSHPWPRPLVTTPPFSYGTAVSCPEPAFAGARHWYTRSRPYRPPSSCRATCIIGARLPLAGSHSMLLRTRRRTQVHVPGAPALGSDFTWARICALAPPISVVPCAAVLGWPPPIQPGLAEASPARGPTAAAPAVVTQPSSAGLCFHPGRLADAAGQ